MDAEDKRTLRVCGGALGAVALGVLLFVPVTGHGNQAPGGGPAGLRATPVVGSTGAERAPTVPDGEPTVSQPSFVPCASDDALGMHLEIDLARARGNISACEWRDALTPQPAASQLPRGTFPSLNLTAPPGGAGYVVACRDGWLSASGGKQGACAHHGGVR